MPSVGLPNLPHISQIRCESIFNGVKVVSLNDFDPVKRRGDGCERDGDHCDTATTAIAATMVMALRCLALFFCVVSRIAGSFFLVRLSFWTNVASVQKHFRETIYWWK